MSSILVSGQICVETTVRVDSFPIPYHPVHFNFFGIKTAVAGVAYNISRALSSLGDTPQLLSLIADDMDGEACLLDLKRHGLASGYVLPLIEETLQSVILYDREGRRQIQMDLKNIQESSYPEKPFLEALETCSIAVLCNMNFSRPFLEAAKKRKKLIATDLHVLGDINDPYNKDFLEYADIIFLSDEAIPGDAGEFMLSIARAYDPEVIVVGLGAYGAILYTRDNPGITHYKAVETRPVVNTIGAGDALFSCFLHYYSKQADAHEALQKAIVFASYKIGETGAARGFLDYPALEKLYLKYKDAL